MIANQHVCKITQTVIAVSIFIPATIILAAASIATLFLGAATVSQSFSVGTRRQGAESRLYIG